MKRHTAKELAVEEFDGWAAASDRFDAVGQAADEEGGPSLSLVPATEGNEVWPTDLLPCVDASAGVALEDSRKRLAGWSGDRQRLFLSTLAETGSVHLASAAARLTARSAYRLRARSPAFAAAWDTADQLAVGRLSAIAFDRAINGRTEQVWHEGILVAEKRLPSDKLLIPRRRRGRASRPCSTRLPIRYRNKRHPHGHCERRSEARGKAVRRWPRATRTAGRQVRAAEPDRRHGTMVP